MWRLRGERAGRRRRDLVALLAACGFWFPQAGQAQATGTQLSGIVRTPDGASLDRARIEAIHLATGARQARTTDLDGAYDFLALAPGSYRISVQREGFAALERDGVVLRVGEHLQLDLVLALGDVRESIRVTAEAPLLQTSSGTVSFHVDRKRVEALPLDGRNFVPLLALAPGVTLPPGSLLPRFSGSRPRTSEYLYDGVSVLQPEPGEVPFFPIVDGIEEFRVETNSYAAEYGRSNGGVILVGGKSGGNQLHGTVFEFLRNERLNARNLFATGGDKPRFRRNQYGFAVGGPVVRNRTFFFTDWQGTRLDTGVVRTSTVPTAAMKRGEFDAAVYDPASTSGAGNGYLRTAFPGGRIPITRMDPVALAALSRYPDPNQGSASANNYRRVGNAATAQDQFDARLDHYAGSRHRMFGRYTYLRDDTRPVRPLPDGSGNITSGALADTLTRSDGIAAEHSWTQSARAVNQLRFGYSRRSFARDSVAIPIYRIAGLQQLGPPASGIGQFSTSLMQVVDHYTWAAGSHTVKAGADLRWENLDALQPPAPTGAFEFNNIFTAALDAQGTPVAGTGNSFASYLLGQVGRYEVDVQPETLKPRARIAEFFLQDDWRANSRLTVNGGLRYTLNIPSTVLGDRGAVFNLDTGELDYLGRGGFPRSARNLDKTGFGPRLGLAYRMAEGFVVRAGYGLTWIEQAGITTPFTTPLFPFIQRLVERSLDNLRPAFVLSEGASVVPLGTTPDAGLGQGVFAVQRDNGSGYAQQWNLSFQKTLSEDWSVEAAYVGSKLTRLGVPDVDLNQLTVEQLALGPALIEPVANPFYGQIPEGSSLGGPRIARAQLLRPYPRYTSVALYRNNIGHSTYHSLQTRVEKRLTRGLSFSASYTFSRLIDDAGQVFNAAIPAGPVASYDAADSHNKRLEKDVSTGNIPHVFSAGLVYALPFAGGWGGGWQIAALARMQSASPVAVRQATNYNAFAGFGIQRPDRLADPLLGGEERTLARWFDTAAFREAGPFQIGNSSRNPVTGPAYRALDVMIGRTFRLGERLRLEVRAEAFNVTNTPPLANPNGTFGAPGFGSITSAGDPRVFEGVAKVHF